MVGKYEVITLCGSTKFKDDFRRIEKELSLKGKIVISLGSFEQAEGTTLEPEIIQMFEDMHRKKIDMSDSIFVINRNGYIGTSTKGEIEYAKSLNKPVYYMEDSEVIDLD